MASSTTTTMMGLISPSRGHLGSATGPSPKRPTNPRRATFAGGAGVNPGEEAVVDEAQIEVAETVRRVTDTPCLPKVHPPNTLSHHNTNTSPHRLPTGTHRHRHHQHRRCPTLVSNSLAGRNRHRHKEASRISPRLLRRHLQVGLARYRVRGSLLVELAPIS